MWINNLIPPVLADSPTVSPATAYKSLKVANTIQDNIQHPIKMTSHSTTLKISNSSRNGKQNVSAVQNQLSGVNTTSVTNNTSLPRNIEITQNPWLLLAQFVVSGAVAGLALVLANRFLDHYRKPCLFIDNDFLKTVHVELALYLYLNPEEVFAELEMFVSKFGDEKNRGSPEARGYVKNIYRTSKDIPVIIAPTEDGWQPAHLNREINPGNATIIVTAKNVKQSLKQNIRILDRRDENGKIIELI
ncbi:MAG: hypothetical protein WBZ36_27175 [Candidatus Nitrosopolaris sp.]